MIYLVCQDWANTSNNHAGMKYLCKTLEQRYPNDYKSIVVPDYYDGFSKNLIIRKICMFIAKLKFKRTFNDIYNILHGKLKKGDKVYLMEYMEKLCPQIDLAIKLKRHNNTIPLYAVVHLVPQRLDKDFTSVEFNKWIMTVDHVVTLGKSLSEYLISRGVNKKKVITTFHYVDNDYYHKSQEIEMNKDKITVIAMGNQMRNTKILSEIVRSLPMVNFIICQGYSDMRELFSDCKNVSLIPFVSENELKEYMEESDISLNVMEDTIGSNVIVTSLAMGLAMICSDVGSIRDYCDENNTIFCKNDSVYGFVQAIKQLQNDKKRLYEMKQSAVIKANSFGIDSFAKNIKFS